MTPPRAIRPLIFCGALLLFLAIFKGDGGYHDLVYYLDDAEGLWLRGDMSRPEEFEDIETPDGTVIGHRPVYSQYALGLAFISGPFVLLAHALERLSGGFVKARPVAVLIIPILGALSALLLFEIGRELKFSLRASFWAAVMFIVGTPVLTFVRLFYTETAIVFFLLLAVWAFLKALDAEAPHRALIWTTVAGAALAGAGACHYAEGVIVVVVWQSMLGTIVFNELRPGHSRVLKILALSVAPVIAVSSILYINYLRRGHFLDTGYSSDVAEISPQNVLHNWRYFFFAIENKVKFGLFVRSPWIVPGMVALLWGTKRESSKWLCRALIAGALLQTLFWMNYSMLAFSPARYLQPATGALAITLLGLGHTLEARWQTRGLYISGVLLTAWNLILFQLGDDRNQTFLFAPDSHEFLMYTWYMRAFPEGITDGYGTPPAAVQYIIFATLIGLGIFCLAHTWQTILRLNPKDAD